MTLPSETDFQVSVDSVQGRIDYRKLIERFGSAEIDDSVISRVERLTAIPVHPFLKRGLFFSHRDLDFLLEAHEAGKRFYLYTGIGPSSERLHLGHLLPFMFTKYLQEAFGAIVVVQITTDEKFLKNPNLSIDDVRRMAHENIKDIIACGFDPEKTFIFSDFDYIGELYPTICSIQRSVTYNQVKGIFGVTGSDSIGKTAFPAVQAAPAFPSSFRRIFPETMSDALCLVPCGIDQDPYFRMTRDVAPKLSFHKPALIHSKFLPSLHGIDKKMSSSDPTSAIFMSDTPQVIKNKIMKYAFSGGGATKEEHMLKGADLTVDIPYHFLRVFLESDEELKLIEEEYGSGRMLTGPVKAKLVGVLTSLVEGHQERRKEITDAVLAYFQEIRERS